MELKEGMYVRTKDGYIDEVIIEYKGYCNNPNCNCKHISCKHNYYDENKIVKTSNNIIDLIEVGDYVNGFRVDEIGEYHSIKTDTVETYAKVNCSALLNCFYKEDIKTVVTKEQFESMSYKVGE